MAMGVEPITVVGIKWDGTTEIRYADKDIGAGIFGRVLDIGGLDDVRNLAGSGGSGSVSVTLDDSDGAIKAIIDTNDVQKVPVYLYQYFSGLDPTTDLFLLFAGAMATPISWSEAERKFSFDAVTHIESIEVGFSPEEAQFSNVSQQLIGKVWPLAFGEVVHIPIVQSVEKLRGVTTTAIGVRDATLPFKYWHLIDRLNTLTVGFYYYISAINVLRALLGAPAIDPDEDDQFGNIARGQIAVRNLDDVLETLNSFESNYITLIFNEQTLAQDHENIANFIHNTDKVVDKFNLLLSKNTTQQDYIDTVNGCINFFKQRQQQLIEGTVELVNFIVEDNVQSQLFTIADVPDAPISSNTIRLDSLMTQCIEQMQDCVTRMGSTTDATVLQSLLNLVTTDLTGLSDGEKEIIVDATTALEQTKAEKQVTEVNIYNAQYAYKTINEINKKIAKLFTDYHKTLQEIWKVQRAIIEQSQMPTSTVYIVNGDQFPQGEIRLEINNLTFLGNLSGTKFTAEQIQPKYFNIKIGPRETDELDAFWLEDESIILKGCFCIKQFIIGPTDPDYDFNNPLDIVRTRMFKVKEQYGNKCVIDLVQNQYRKNPRVNNGINFALTDLPQGLWNLFADAHSHTRNEIVHILENGIEKYQTQTLKDLKSKIEKLHTLLGKAPNLDYAGAVNETITKDINEYNSLIQNLRFKKEAVEKATEKITEHEFQELLKLENLKMLLLNSGIDTTPTRLTSTDNVYYITGPQITGSIAAASPVMLPTWFGYSPQGQELTDNETILPLPGSNTIRANYLPESTFWFAPAGSEVDLTDQTSEKFIVNIIPSTIIAVYGKQQVGQFYQLTPLPEDMYTFLDQTNGNDTSYPPLICCSLTMKQPISAYNLGYDNQIYVSIISSVGPNTADIVTWIIETWTNLSVDSTNMNHIRSVLANYPQSFVLLQKMDALRLIEDIAWQNRCASYIKNEVVYLQYLAETPTPVKTFTEDDIEDGSMTIELTSTEDIVTKFIADWKNDYAENGSNKSIFRYNIAKYGLWPKSYSFYTFNIESLVQKTSTFWLIRYANAWKRISFTTFLTNLDIESFDHILIDFADNFLANEAIPCLVEQCSFDSNAMTIKIVCWCPVRSGEMTQYNFAYPAGITEEDIFPPADDIALGLAGNFKNSFVPTNEAFRIDPNINLFDAIELRPKDYGGIFPSDLSDVLPPSPLQGLDVANYVINLPSDYQLPEEPQVPLDNYGKPDYKLLTLKTPVVEPGNTSFIGQVVEVVDETVGVYKVQKSNGDIHEVDQKNATDKLKALGDNIHVSKDNTLNRFVFNADEETDTNIQSYWIVSEDFDYINAIQFDFDPTDTQIYNADNPPQGETIKIAKPYFLQKTPFDQQTVSLRGSNIQYDYTSQPAGQRFSAYQSSPLTTSVVEQIIPPYFVGDIIFAYKTPTNVGADWIDMNQAARAWASVST